LNAQALIALLTCLVALTLSGCDRVEPIGHYQTRKEASLRHLSGEPARDETPAEPTDRIVAAIIPRGERAWIFRLTGPVAPVGQQLERFKQLVRSTHFDEADGGPKWTLPEGWTERPSSGLRYATIDIPPDGANSAGGPPLDLSVSVLPGSSEADFDPYVLANVNRWRSQLSLAPLPPLRLSDAVEELKTDAFTATLVDLSGKRKADDGMSRGPFAPGGPAGGNPGVGSPPREKGAAPTGPASTGPAPKAAAPATGPAPAPSNSP
jgi:hypothetical protein